MQRFLECAANRHRFANAFHPRRQRRVRLRKFFEREARNFYNAIIDRRLETGGCLARNVVFDFVECVTDREFRSDFCNREAGRFRCQGARTRNARVHLNHNHAPVRRIDRELNVRSAGLNSDLANDRKGGVAHHLVFFVGQRLRGRDGDRVPGVHAHRIEVLDRTNDDAVIHPVAHYFHLEFFPANE